MDLGAIDWIYILLRDIEKAYDLARKDLWRNVLNESLIPTKLFRPNKVF
jgi:hypothetical protein